MTAPIPPVVLALVTISVLLAGAVNGVAGFGFAVLATTLLATVIDPAIAVVFMIVPIMAVNLSLVRDLSVQELRTCGRRFAPLILAAFIGAIVGLAALDRVPEGPLRLLLGMVALGFVASAQRLVRIPGRSRARERCFVERPLAMAGVGAVSGLLFGGTNVGVQLIAYLRSCDLSHGVFVGVVAMVFLGLNGVRVAAAGLLGLYPDTTVLLASIVVAIPAVAGVAIGKRLRGAVAERHRRAVVLGLIATIGVRLVLGGIGLE